MPCGPIGLRYLQRSNRRWAVGAGAVGGMRVVSRDSVADLQDEKVSQHVNTLNTTDLCA